ncbi:MAG: hypothetical protein KDJ65_24560, partial [Anaerolineae bacterium]|nr:hypothetical protein [Anaerolineae bacterium]
MDIKEQLIEQLKQFATKGPEHVEAVIQSTPEPGYILGVLSETDAGVGASLSVADYDRFSVALRHLEIFNKSTTVDADEVKTYLQQSAEAIVEALTYLEEPLELLELDPAEGIAQIRSNPPLSNADENEVTYWELFLRATPHAHVRLTRYHWSADTGDRNIVAYPATFTTLGRIAEDLANGLA